MNKNMLKFIKIRNSYTIPKIGELSINEKALLEYEKFCLELMNQAEKQKEVIDKAIEHINEYESIRAYYEYIDEDGYDEYNYDEDFKKELLDILNEVTNNE